MDLTPEEMRVRSQALPDGWAAGCRAQDDPWVDRFSNLDFPADISSPTDALPAGYEAYLAVMHQLEDNDGPRPWVTDPSGNPWAQVHVIVEHGLDGWPYAADIEIGPPQSLALIAQLGLSATPRRPPDISLTELAHRPRKRSPLGVNRSAQPDTPTSTSPPS